MTDKPTAPEPAEEPVRIKLSGDMQKTGEDLITIAGKHDLVKETPKKDSTDVR